MRTVLAVLAAYLAFALALPFLLLHPKVRDGVLERLGFFSAKRKASLRRHSNDTPRVWLHGASAGDVLALLPLARALRGQDTQPRQANIEVYISATTNSGHTICKANGTLFNGILFFPYDLPGSTARVLDLLHPDVLVLEYTELWPRLLAAAKTRGIDTVLHNGRFSARRLERYKLLFALIGNIVQQLSLLLMRDELEAERAVALGASEHRVLVTGNTKFDNVHMGNTSEFNGQIQKLARSLGRAAHLCVSPVPPSSSPGNSPSPCSQGSAPCAEHAHLNTEGTKHRPLWVAGSTHEGEEDILLRVFNRVRENIPNLQLLVAPRYIERTDRLIQLVERSGFTVCRRSTNSGAECAKADVLVLNTIGELGSAYALADLVFVGGSFTNRGGHNLLEPAACGKVVLFGPHIENVTDSVQVLLGRGGIQVADEAQLQRVVTDLLLHPENLADLGATAAQQVHSVFGAAEKNAAEIWRLLNASNRPPVSEGF